MISLVFFSGRQLLDRIILFEVFAMPIIIYIAFVLETVKLLFQEYNYSVKAKLIFMSAVMAFVFLASFMVSISSLFDNIFKLCMFSLYLLLAMSLMLSNINNFVFRRLYKKSIINSELQEIGRILKTKISIPVYYLIEFQPLILLAIIVVGLLMVLSDILRSPLLMFIPLLVAIAEPIIAGMLCKNYSKNVYPILKASLPTPERYIELREKAIQTALDGMDEVFYSKYKKSLLKSWEEEKKVAAEAFNK